MDRYQTLVFWGSYSTLSDSETMIFKMSTLMRVCAATYVLSDIVVIIKEMICIFSFSVSYTWAQCSRFKWGHTTIFFKSIQSEEHKLTDTMLRNK